MRRCLILPTLAAAPPWVLDRLRSLPPCRFDVLEVTPTGVNWLQAAFDAGG